MTGFVRAFQTTDIPNGSARLFRYQHKRIAIWQAGGRFFAADNRCPHQGYALASPTPPFSDKSGISGFRSIFLDGMPEDAVAGVLGALDTGRSVPDVIDVIASVAASRLGRFDMDSDTDDSRDAGWLDVTHTLTYTNALRWA